VNKHNVIFYILYQKEILKMSKKPVVLMVLDGYGLNPKVEGNAIAQANTPVMDKLMAECPYAPGNASGMSVGLPDGQMGNSEVGHMNIGAGRVIYQELTRITKSIQDGDFFQVAEFKTAVENCKKNNSDMHFYGLLSDGGVHSHNTHLYGLLELAKREGLSNVYVHCFLDGRDTPPASGKGYVEELQAKMDEIGVGKIASVHGRYYAMDRDNNWDRVEKAYNALVLGEGKEASDGITAVANSYAEGNNDEFVIPCVVKENGAPVATIKANDSVIFFNFRPDRAREITRAFCDESFTGFERKNGFLPLTYVCFTDYDETIGNKLVAFKKESVENTFGEYLAQQGKTQLRLAETEKYAHVTFFFNGGIEEPNKNEERSLVKSPAVATYDLKPEMSAPEVGERLNAAITSGKYDVIVINFANPDMVGHTGVIKAAIAAVERVDQCVGAAVSAVKQVDGVLFICADHGNAEQMINYETGDPHTAHTTNQVPFILVNYEEAKALREGGALCDIAPTLLDIMGLEQPAQMTGKSLIIR
jgi:2,3-bisphosphoglycerate-independent phosphoglycerate mutase